MHCHKQNKKGWKQNICMSQSIYLLEFGFFFFKLIIIKFHCTEVPSATLRQPANQSINGLLIRKCKNHTHTG